MTQAQRKIILAVQDLGGDNVRIVDLHNKLGGAKSGIHRKLQCLIEEGYLHHIPTRGYTLIRPIPKIAVEYQVWCDVFKSLVPLARKAA
jgi:DNA-binding IclR family transcriptional regulator